MPDLTIGANTIESRNLWLVAGAGRGGEVVPDGKGEVSRGRFEGMRDAGAEVDAILDILVENRLLTRSSRRARSIDLKHCHNIELEA